MQKLILTLMFFWVPVIISAQVWIYSDDGTWNDGIIALEQFLKSIGETSNRVYAEDLNNDSLIIDAKAIVFPGGYAYNYKTKLSMIAIENIRKYVANGGSYIGICAGAYFASSSVLWEGVDYPYSLELFKGSAVGSIHNIAPWDNYKMTKIATKSNLNIDLGDKEYNVLYYGGPYFVSNSTYFNVLATWMEYYNLPAIINFYYQKGKVLLIGPHLEIEENSDRDSTNFAEALDDIETDWELLKSIITWAIRTEPSTAFNDTFCKQNISPNPASDYINVQQHTEGMETTNDLAIKIYNTYGELVHEELPSISIPNDKTGKTSSIRINISHLPTGLYFIKIAGNIEKFMVLR